MGKEVKSKAITNRDANDPIQATVIRYVWNPNIHGLVCVNPDWTPIAVWWGSQTLEEVLINWNSSNWRTAIFWDWTNETIFDANWYQSMMGDARPRMWINHEWFIPISFWQIRGWWWIEIVSLETIWSTPEREQLDQWSGNNFWWVFHLDLPRNHRIEQLSTNFVLPTWIDISSEDSEIRFEIHWSTADREASGIVAWKIYYQIANPIRCCDTEPRAENSYENYEDVLTLYDCDLSHWNRGIHYVTLYNGSWIDAIRQWSFPYIPWCLVRCTILRDIWWDDTFRWDISLDAFKIWLVKSSIWKSGSDRPNCKEKWFIQQPKI